MFGVFAFRSVHRFFSKGLSESRDAFTVLYENRYMYVPVPKVMLVYLRRTCDLSHVCAF